MDNKYNELNYAKAICEEGFKTNYIPTELRLASIYMRTILGYKPKKVREELHNLCKKTIPNYNSEQYYKAINNAVLQASKKNSTLIQIDQVNIYDYELAFLNKIPLTNSEGIIVDHEYDCRKLMFTILVQLKLNKMVSDIKNKTSYSGLYFKGGQKKYNELKKIAKLPIKIKINEDIIYNLAQCKMITIMFNGLIKINFMELLEQYSSNICKPITALSVKNFETIGWYFDYYNEAPKMKLCRQCSQPFKFKSNRQIYCNDDCSMEAQRNHCRIRVQKHRSSTVKQMFVTD